MNIQLLVIDAQNDFCDPSGALYVPGAKEDVDRLTTFVREHKDKLTGIYATLDTHKMLHIAHPVWWVDADGNHPDVFTAITEEDATGADAKWRAADSNLQEYTEMYVKQLAKNGRYDLVIWPPHCIEGTEGNKICADLKNALLEWEQDNRKVNYVLKGTNMHTEHYSAIKADVVHADDPNTDLNQELIDELQRGDMVLIAGEALSHCVANTVRDIAANIPAEDIKKYVLLLDTTSPVTGFETLADEFVAEMKEKGMQVKNTNEIF